MVNKNFDEWFAERLSEIMDDRKMNIHSLTTLSGISRTTLRKVLDGQYISSDTVKRIAKALNISEQRLRCGDIEYEPTQWSRDRVIYDLEQELQIARNNLANALGPTERGLASLVLGSIFFCAGNFNNAADAYHQSHIYLRQNDNAELLMFSLEGLLHTYLALEDFISFEKTIEESLALFKDDLHKYRSIIRLKAYAMEKQKKYTDAIHLYRSVLNGDIDPAANQIISNVLSRLGSCLLELEQYNEAFPIFTTWYKQYLAFSDDPYNHILNYAKTAFVTGHSEIAIDLLEFNLPHVVDNQDMTRKYLVFLSLMKKTIHPDLVALLDECDPNTQLLVSMMMYLSHEDRLGFKRLSQQLTNLRILDTV